MPAPAKSADIAKLLLLNKCRIIILPCGVWQCTNPPPNHNCNPTQGTVTVIMPPPHRAEALSDAIACYYAPARRVGGIKQ